MRRIFKFALLLVLAFGIVLVSLACGQKRSAYDILMGALEKEKQRPTGEIYRSGADFGEAGYLSSDMISLLYGHNAEKFDFLLIEEYAIYICSFAEPFEAAVFRCYSESDTDSVAKMCFYRVDTVSSLVSLLGYEGIETRVMTDGRNVYMYIGTNADGAESAFMASGNDT